MYVHGNSKSALHTAFIVLRGPYLLPGLIKYPLSFKQVTYLVYLIYPGKLQPFFCFVSETYI